MDRQIASKTCREYLDKYNLSGWKVILNLDNTPFLGRCDWKTQSIILNALAIDIHPDDEVIDTIKHEVAHALTPNDHHHGLEWAAKAEELGARTTMCAEFNVPEHVLDAIRSGQNVEMTFDTIKIPKYKVTRLQDKCPECGKVAIERFNIESIDKEGNIVRLITLECFHIIKKIIPKGTEFHKLVSNWWKPEVASCLHDWDKTVCKRCGETKLYTFQVDGCKAAESGLSIQKGFGIFDDMGLGKTVQALAIIKFHSEYSPTLFIVKSALKFQFFKEIIKWLSPSHMPQIISTSKDFVFPGLKSYIISYDLLRRFPREKIAALGIKLVVLDECQQIKNPDSTRTQEVRKIVGASVEIKVLPLSGTPWKNRGGEFFPVLNMISPTKFHSHQAYLDRWVDFYMHGNTRKQGGIKNPTKFREYVQDILIRREYEEVMDEFPEINRMKLNVQLDELSQSTYDDEVSEFVKWYNQALIDGMEEKLSGIELLGKMSRMRHITGLAKIPATVGFVEEFIEDTDRKLVIFVHHKDVSDLLYNEILPMCKEAGIPLFHLKAIAGPDGDALRFEMSENFNKAPRAFMIASTLASGEGLNLQTCADCVLHERQWNPQNEDQAAPGRFRRIGQKAKSVNITFTEADDTIDQHIGAIVETKRKAFHDVMNKGEAPVWNEGDFAKELAETIVRKHKEKNKGKDNLTIKGKSLSMNKPVSQSLF